MRRYARPISLLTSLVILTFVVGCQAVRQETMTVADPDAVQYFKSPPVERESVGLDPIPTSGQVLITHEHGYLRVDFERSDFLKTIFIEPTADGYRWFAEEDTHYGPLTYEESSAPESEQVYIAYSSHNSESGPSEGLYVSYSGPRPEFQVDDYHGLELKTVAPLIAEWRGMAE